MVVIKTYEDLTIDFIKTAVKYYCLTSDVAYIAH